MQGCSRTNVTNQAIRNLVRALVKIHVIHLLSAEKVFCDYTLNQYPAKCREVNVLSRPVASQVWCKNAPGQKTTVSYPVKSIVDTFNMELLLL